MKTNFTFTRWLTVPAFSVLSFSTLTAFAQGTAFTYQGRLNDGGSAANGVYDLRFAICDSATGGNTVGGPVTNTAAGVTNGLFTVTLDFGADVFDGSARWLGIGVRTNGSEGDFILLSPRQALTATPYALYAPSAGMAASAGSVAAANITGTVTLAQLPGAVLTNNATGVTISGNVSGMFTGDGGGLTNITATAVPTAPSGMVLIPAGSFTMGDTLDGTFDAVPVAANISAFYMEVNLVSLSQWQSFYFWATNHGYGFANAGAGKAANHPVETVDWYDCVKWCNARSQQAGWTPVYYTDAGLTQVYTNGDGDGLCELGGQRLSVADGSRVGEGGAGRVERATVSVGQYHHRKSGQLPRKHRL